jgi:hypothetical protein
MAEQPMRVVLTVDDVGDDEERAELSEQLRRELRDTDVSVEPPPSAEAPDRAKGLAEVVHEIPIAGQAIAVHAVMVMLYEFVDRHRHRRIHVRGPDGQQITVPDVPPEEAAKLLSVWAGDL